MALRAESFEKRSNNNIFRRAITFGTSQTDKGKDAAQNSIPSAPIPRVMPY